jgi:sulfite reductase (NADPH) flavoprotein alpha-component
VHYFAALLVVLAYGLFCGLCWWRYRRQHPIISALQIESGTLVIGYASQTGSAMHLAMQTAQQLQSAALPVQVLPLNQISPELLFSVSTLLLVTSTYGEGEAPDNANRFISRNIANLKADSLVHLRIGILALGDSSYQHFCGFAHQVQRELHLRGASDLFDLVEVDQLDESALRHWQYYLGQLSGNTHFSDWVKPSYTFWQLTERRWLNPGSPGAPAFHLKFSPLHGDTTETSWQAGDIAEIGPCNSAERIDEFLRLIGRSDIDSQLLSDYELPFEPERYHSLRNLDAQALIDQLSELPHREYSIASVPMENTLDLLVRQVRDEHHQLGLGSGWLTVHALLYSPIRLRVRSNPHFHSPSLDTPLILIGNGTGMAGLRAHLAWRAQSSTRNWLLFGERTAANDYFFEDDLNKWQSQGVLTRLDLVFSRDAVEGQPRYVQDLLYRYSADIKTWVNSSAAIYVCGSLQGMAQGVDAALRQILGNEELERLADQGRYRRDVY